MRYIDSVASVPCVAATCGSGPAEEERLKKLKADEDAAAIAKSLAEEEKPATTPPKTIR